MDERVENETYWAHSNIKDKAANTFDEHHINECSNLRHGLQQSQQYYSQFPSKDLEEEDGFQKLDQDEGTDRLPPSARLHKTSVEKPSKSEVSASGLAKLEAQVKHFKSTSKEPLSVDALMLQIVTDQRFYLEDYRSLEHKLDMLDKAIDFHDGNAIIRVVLHLKNRTKSSFFHQAMRKRPVAVHHYVNYLKVQKRFMDIVDFYEMLGEQEEAAMIQYEMALNKSSAESIVKNLQNCLLNHFQTNGNLINETQLVKEHLMLLERQLPVEASDKRAEREGNVEVFKQHPRIDSLIGQSLLDTLYYCCLYHHGEKENNFASPEGIKKNFHLSAKQFVYVSVSALAQHALWRQMDLVIFTKTYIGGTKLKSDINMERILEIISPKGAPYEVMKKYISFIEHPETRLRVANAYKVYEVSIETLVRMREKQELQSLRNKLSEHSREWSLAEEALRRPDVNWKS